MSAPLRFLLVLLAGWIGMRAILLGPAFLNVETALPPYAADARSEARPPVVPAWPDTQADSGAPEPPTRQSAPTQAPPRIQPPPSRNAHRIAQTPSVRRPLSLDAGGRLASSAPVAASHAMAASLEPIPTLPFSAPHPIARTSPGRRLSGSAWLLARGDVDATALAPGGTLGGSQAGARLLYRLNDDPARPLSLSARLYAPLRRTAGAEAALGLDWRPFANLPVHLLAERRQRLGREGRSAFAITAYGGGSVALGRGLRLDAYAQAGLVGLRSRDPFLDGSIRVAAPLGPAELGGALWAGAQPGVQRLDVGPQLTLPIRTGGIGLRLSADYRFRVAGEARPGSGPALTIGTDF